MKKWLIFRISYLNFFRLIWALAFQYMTREIRWCCFEEENLFNLFTSELESCLMCWVLKLQFFLFFYLTGYEENKVLNFRFKGDSPGAENAEYLLSCRIRIFFCWSAYCKNSCGIAYMRVDMAACFSVEIFILSWDVEKFYAYAAVPRI